MYQSLYIILSLFLYLSLSLSTFISLFIILISIIFLKMVIIPAPEVARRFQINAMFLAFQTVSLATTLSR